ncbi:hypothetical protein AC579_5026 [Pseudocercospora musae]|uniref:Dioxygenase n=1 Tax=Pseudocercospora musae TaxID=113226 RepID=A0A139IAI8_9PEZI|nr:hypothetical protein AC579_5026 [Pseudocercospora musae]
MTESQDHLHGWPNASGFQVENEQREPIELPVTGHIPAALAGTLYRTGPSSYKHGNFSFSHWFDGFTQVYRFQLIPQADGSCKVVYNSRRQCDRFLERVRKSGRTDKITFAQRRDPCEGIFGKLKAIFFSANASEPTAADANVGVTVHLPVHGNNGLLETRTDNFQLKRIDRETLEPVGVTDQTRLNPELKGPLSCAHAQFDPVTGDCFNFNLQFGRFATYRIFRTSAKTGETDVLATFSAPDIQAAYIHAFFLTESYVVLCVWNAHFGGGGLKVLWERNFLDAIVPFNESVPVQWLVVDRKGGRGLVKRFTSPAMFAFHTVNAFEETRDGKVDILCDVAEYPSLEMLHGIYYENLVSNASAAGKAGIKKSHMARYRLRDINSPGTWDMAKDKPGEAERVMYLPYNGDLPTINPAYKCKSHRFVYGIRDDGKSSFYDSIQKLDVATEQSTSWCRDKHTPGEPIFVADPARGDREDGGWVLSCVLDGEKGTSYLLCLDAETLKEVARADVGAAVGLGFHGTHIPG